MTLVHNPAAGCFAARLGPAVLVTLLLLVACGPPTAITPTQLDLPFPSPLAGPGKPPLDDSDQRHLDRAWRELVAGQLIAASDQLARATQSPPALLLAAQLALANGEQPSTPELVELAESSPDYASAWLTLSASAEIEGAEELALQSARRGAALWDARPWRERVTTLETRWIRRPIKTADQLLGEGESGRALELVDRALALAPSNRDGILVKARALIDLEQTDDAEQVLASLPGDPEALLLAGAIAERRRDWLTAMAIYESLPPTAADRDQILHRARLQWRLSNLPDYVHSAISSPVLTRSQLAVLLVALAPQLESKSVGPVPLLTDIVDLPSQREIVTAVRAGLLDVDRLERRFYPALLATDKQVRQALEGLSRLLGVAEPQWCQDRDAGSPEPGCLAMEDPVTGEWLAAVVLQLLAEEEE